MCSGEIALYQSDGKEQRFDTRFQGTAISLRVRTDTNNSFKEVLSRVIREGETKAKKISESITKASKSSGGKYYE